MTAPKRRRRFRSSLRPGHLIAADIAASIAILIALTNTHVLIWALLTALAATVAYTFGRMHNQPAPRRARAEFAKRNRAGQRSVRPVGTQPRGVRPPASPNMVTLQVSLECAEGTCGICPRTGGCECSCNHDSAEIVRRCEREYDRTHGKVPE